MSTTPPPPPREDHPTTAPPPPQREDHPRTTPAFVLALVALTFVLFLFWLVIPLLLAVPMGIVALVFATQARRDMRAEPGRYRNEGLASAALVIGWVTIGLVVVGILLVALFALLMTGMGFDGMHMPDVGDRFFQGLAPLI